MDARGDWLPFDDVPPLVRVPSPLCIFETRCPRRGVAELGPDEVFDDCVNRTIRCLTCGATGIESRNTEPRARGVR